MQEDIVRQLLEQLLAIWAYSSISDSKMHPHGARIHWGP